MGFPLPLLDLALNPPAHLFLCLGTLFDFSCLSVVTSSLPLVLLLFVIFLKWRMSYSVLVFVRFICLFLRTS